MQSPLATREMIRLTGTADENQLGREVPDPRESLELFKSTFTRQRPESRRVEPAPYSRFSDSMQILDLAGEQAWEAGHRSETLWARKRVQTFSVNDDFLTELLRHALLDARGLRNTDAVSDNRPRCGFIGGPEEYRPQPCVRALQCPHDAVALAHAWESRSIHVERQDAGDLSANKRPTAISENLSDHGLARLPNAHSRRVLPSPFHGEGEVQVIRLLRYVMSGGRKAFKEADARLE